MTNMVKLITERAH